MISNPYSVLANFYDVVGMSDFAAAYTPRIIEFFQQQDWLGRRIIDLGCGTGASIRWLANRGYATTGVDLSRDMIDVARGSMPTSGLSLSWHQADVRTISEALGTYDMAIAFDLLNELGTLRDLEQSFAAVLRVLEPGKPFVFDMTSIHGLAERGRSGEQVIHDDGQLMVINSHDFDYDRQILHVRYRVFSRMGDSWHRSETRRTLRGFPAQAIVTLLQRTGFNVAQPMRPSFEPIDVSVETAERILFIGIKP